MSNSTSMPSAAKKPSCCATKSLRPMPLGATRTLRMFPPSESICYAEARVVGALRLGDRAARRVLVQPAAVQAREQPPALAQIMRAFHAERGVEQAAIADGVVRPFPLGAAPGRLRVDRDQRAGMAVDAEARAQVPLLAAVVVQVPARARQQVERRGADRGVPFEVDAVGRARVE